MPFFRCSKVLGEAGIRTDIFQKLTLGAPEGGWQNVFIVYMYMSSLTSRSDCKCSPSVL